MGQATLWDGIFIGAGPLSNKRRPPFLISLCEQKNENKKKP